MEEHPEPSKHLRDVTDTTKVGKEEGGGHPKTPPSQRRPLGTRRSEAPFGTCRRGRNQLWINATVAGSGFIKPVVRSSNAKLEAGRLASASLKSFVRQLI